MNTPDIIRNRRQELNLTQAELAEKMGMQSKSSVANMERPGAKISLKTIKKLTVPLKCTEAYLLGMTSDPNCATMDLVLPKDPSGFEVWPKEERPKKKIKPHGMLKTAISTPQDAKVEVKSAFTAVGSGRDAMQTKVTGVEVIDPGQRIRSGPPKKRIPKPVLNEREKLIKKIIDLPDDLIDEVSSFIDFQISKLEGGE